MVLKDEELVARAQEEDKDALDELFSRYLHKAYAIAYSMCSGDHEQAQDITQEAFLKAFRSIKKFRREASFSTWLYRIIANTYFDSSSHRKNWERIFSLWRWRKQKRESKKDVLEELPDIRENKNPLNVLHGKQFEQDIKNALKLLPDKQRIVFQLKVFSEMSIREIAQIMGSAEGTVKSHLFRATLFLRNTLSDWKN